MSWGNVHAEQNSNLLLAFARTVILDFGPCQDSWPLACSEMWLPLLWEERSGNHYCWIPHTPVTPACVQTCVYICLSLVSVSKICHETLLLNHIPKIVKNGILFSCLTFLFNYFLTCCGTGIESSLMFLCSIQALELVNCLSLFGQQGLEEKG
jgi:hypothetical protein